MKSILDEAKKNMIESENYPLSEDEIERRESLKGGFAALSELRWDVLIQYEKDRLIDSIYVYLKSSSLPLSSLKNIESLLSHHHKIIEMYTDPLHSYISDRILIEARNDLVNAAREYIKRVDCLSENYWSEE